MFTYSSTYYLDDKNKLTQHNNIEQLISEYPLDKRLYLEGTTEMRGRVVIDLSKYLTYHNTTSISNTRDICNSLSDQLVDRYVSEAIPFKDLASDRFNNRVVTSPVVGDENYEVQFTSIENPAYRDQIDLKELCNDLVITGKTSKSLHNTIFTVNGICHRQVFDDSCNEMYLVDAYLNCRRKKAVEICGIDFTDIGGVILDQVIEEKDLLSANENGYVYFRTGVGIKDVIPFVVLNGYMFYDPDRVTVVNQNTIRFDMRGIDIGSLYVNNPMTQYTRGAGYSESKSTGTDIEFPDTLDKLIFLEGNSNDLPELDTVGKELFPYPKYMRSDGLDSNPYFLTENFHNKAYFNHILTNGTTRLILVSSKDVRIKTYRGYRNWGSEVYEFYSKDTPRGIMFYNRRMVIPYTIMSTEDTLHCVYLGSEKATTELHATRYETPMYLGVKKDIIKYGRNIPVELVEFYKS